MAQRHAARRRLPAFGRELLDLRRRGLMPDPAEVFVALDTWEHAKQRTRVVVPQDADPAELDFSFVAGIDAWLIWLPQLTSIARRDDAIRAVLRGLPARFIMIEYADPVRFVWIKSAQVGVELAEFAA